KATHLPDASLYQITGANSRTLLEGVTVSNGIGFQAPYLYYIDSKCNNVRKFLYENNTLQFVEEVFSISDGTTLDGMTISKSNKLYIANWGGQQILICDLSSGKITGAIYVTAVNSTSCTFWGSLLNELFIAASRIRDDNNSLSGVYVVPLEDEGYIQNKILNKTTSAS